MVVPHFIDVQVLPVFFGQQLCTGIGHALSQCGVLWAGVRPGVSDVLSAAKKELFSGDASSSGAVPFVNVTSEAAGACPALLCKVRPAALAACNVYQVRAAPRLARIGFGGQMWLIGCHGARLELSMADPAGGDIHS